jgi:hypothetical protein
VRGFVREIRTRVKPLGGRRKFEISRFEHQAVKTIIGAGFRVTSVELDLTGASANLAPILDLPAKIFAI